MGFCQVFGEHLSTLNNKSLRRKVVVYLASTIGMIDSELPFNFVRSRRLCIEFKSLLRKVVVHLACIELRIDCELPSKFLDPDAFALIRLVLHSP